MGSAWKNDRGYRGIWSCGFDNSRERFGRARKELRPESRSKRWNFMGRMAGKYLVGHSVFSSVKWGIRAMANLSSTFLNLEYLANLA